MSGAGIVFRIGDLPRMETALRSARARALDLAPLMDQIGMEMETTTHERFASESDAQGNPWKPSIRARTEGGQTLRDDGHLDNSITHRFSSDEVEIGSNLIYAAPNFFGAVIRAKNGPHLKFRLPGRLGFVSVESVTLPERNPLGIGGDDPETIMELTGDYILGELGG